jgi:DNA gyrase/topoisomerase IV subunit A
MIKRTNVSEIITTRANKAFTIIKLQDNDEVVSVRVDDTADEDNTLLAVITKNGFTLSYPINQISVVGRNASGVKNISTDDEIVGVTVLNKEYVVVGTNNGYKILNSSFITVGKRVGKPKQLLLNGHSVINIFSISENEKFVSLLPNGKLNYVVIEKNMLEELDGIFKNKKNGKIESIFYLNAI